MLEYTVERIGWNMGDGISKTGVYIRNHRGYSTITKFLDDIIPNINRFTIKDLSKYGIENDVDIPNMSWYKILTCYKILGKSRFLFDASYNMDSLRRMREIKIPMFLPEKEIYNYKIGVLNDEGFYISYPLEYCNHGIWGQHNYEQHKNYTNDYKKDSNRRYNKQDYIFKSCV